jgi:hypothetical protein
MKRLKKIEYEGEKNNRSHRTKVALHISLEFQRPINEKIIDIDL